MSKDKFLAIEAELKSRYIQRDDEIHGMLLATLSGQHILFVGPPGTAKSMIVYDYSRYLQARHFKYLLTQFTTPDELFGPVSLSGLKEDRHRRVTTKKLPEAQVAYLDEVFKAGSTVLNTLLKILQEREYDNDTTTIACPLLFCAASSNELPEESDGDGLSAFYDRFLLRYLTSYIDNEGDFRRLLDVPEPVYTAASMTYDEVIADKDDAQSMPIDPDARDGLAVVWTKLREAGIIMSDRRYRMLLKVMAAESWLQGLTSISPDSLLVGVNVLWNKPDEIRKVQQIVRTSINPVKAKADTIIEAAREALKNLHEYTESNQMVQLVRQLKQMRGELVSLTQTGYVQAATVRLDEMGKQVTNKLLGVS